MKGTLAPQSVKLLELLLADNKISEALFHDEKSDSSKYVICTITEHGDVILGKTRHLWWNRLLNCQKVIPFDSFAFIIWDVFVDASSGVNNEAIIRGLSHEIIMNAVRNKEYDYVVNRLFDCYRYVAQKTDGFQKGMSFGEDETNGQGLNEIITPSYHNNDSNIYININDKAIPIVDSTGRSWIDIVFSPTKIQPHRN